MTDAQIPRLDLNELLAAAQLAALPQSAIRLLELSQDPTNGPAEFAVPIESDPGLAGQVLRFVNSSYFGFSREISNVKLAITLVGIRTIKNFALWSAVFSLMPNPRCGPFDLKSLWQDSLRRALFARALAKLLGLKEAEETFSAALLQDMAIPMLGKQVPESYTALLQSRDEGNVRLSDLEMRHFGWTHAEAGGLMARNWNLPEDFAVLIENHLDIERWASEPQAEAGKLSVAMSGLLPAIGDPIWTECSRFEELYSRITPAGSPSMPAILEQIDAEYGDFAPVLKLAAASKTLMDAFRGATQGGVVSG
jgi:HD-like signal output (HDOD) protein